MFVIPFSMEMHFESILLLASGPGFAIFFPVDDGERSTIWCFFSVMEELITFGSQILSIRFSHKNTVSSTSNSETKQRKKAYIRISTKQFNTFSFEK